MALINCPECGRKGVSDTAEFCPGCGYNVKAHFDEITQEKLKEEQVQKEEEKKKQAEEDRKRHEEERIKSVPRPSKPKISIKALILSIFLFLIAIMQLMSSEYERQLSILNHTGDPVFSGAVLLIFGIVVLGINIYSYLKQSENYNLAQTNFEAYQRKIIKIRDEVSAQQEARDEAEQKRQLYAPQCPSCGSTDIVKISAISRAISVEIAGLASSNIGKQFECKRCGYKW
ncbi:MAG: zinc ribbon domain-containing protein [Lacrimispora sp.]